ELTDLIRAAVEQTDAFRKPGVELRDETGTRSVVCTVDPMRIQEVFVNLLKNAYEATPRGRVRIRLQDLGSLVAVSISDTGSGIPPEVQSRLFEAFFTTKKKGEGTGLGLAICRNFVASHGDDIDLLVTDFQMPGRNGVELIEAARKANHLVPAILMTAYLYVYEQLDADRRKDITLLRKPFDADEILREIAARLDNGNAPKR